MPTPLLYWSDLHRNHLLAPSSATVHTGDCVVLSGASGSGKSLLWRALAGLDACSFRQLRCLKQDYRSCSPSRWRSLVAYVSQQTTFSDGSGEDALRVPFTYRAHRQRSFNKAQIIDWLAALGKSAELLAQPVNALSGGERHIIHVLRSLQFAPNILLLDEPTAALDQESTQRFEALMQQWLKAQSERAILWISHDQAQSARIANVHWQMHAQQLSTTP